MKKGPISATAGGPSKGIVPSKQQPPHSVPVPSVPQTDRDGYEVGVVRVGGAAGTHTGAGASTGARHRKVLQEAADLNAKFTSSVKLSAPQVGSSGGALDATAGAGALGDPTGAANDYESAKVKARVKKSSDLDDERRSVMDLDRWESVLNHGTNGAAAGGADDDWD